MRAVLQRVRKARVDVDGVAAGEIGVGILVLVGIAKTDMASHADYLAGKICNLRIFEDEAGKMNRSVRDIAGGLLIVSQFTLYSDCAKGRRPSFETAAPAAQARELYEYFLEKCRQTGILVQTGVFQATMTVYLENDGPVTLICDAN
jgi:D-aminoacyl-tRNA deacylase